MASLTSNLAILAGAGIGSAIAGSVPDRNTRLTLQIASGLIAGIAAIDIALTAKKLIQESNREFWAAIMEAAQMPAGTGSLFERGLGMFGRATGNEPGPSIETTPDRPATEGPKLGNPKNALLIAGKIRSVENQEITPTTLTISFPLFSDTGLVDAAIENQGSNPQTGQVRARLLIKSTPYMVNSPPITLAPGEFRTVSLRVPRDYSYYGTYDLALQWNNFTLDRVTFSTR